MSWGKELWDQTNSISAHTLKGIEFLERYAAFIKDRCSVELQYASSLRGLAKKHQIKKKENDEMYSYMNAFSEILNELSDMAGQHEVVADALQERIIGEIGKLVKEYKEQRKKHLAEIDKLEQNRVASVEAMKKTYKEYAKAHDEAVSARKKYEKAEVDLQLSRAEVAKAKLNSISKSQQANDAKSTYALELSKTNESQHQFYTELLPSVLEKLREMDEDRILKIQHLFQSCVEVEKSTLPIILRCLDGMLKEVDKISSAADSQLVIERYRSGYGLPEDFGFLDLGPETATSNGAAADDLANGHEPDEGADGMPKPDFKQLNRAYSGRKKGGTLRKLFGHKWSEDKKDFNELPPSQQCKRIQAKLRECERVIEKKHSEKQGLLKMITLYTEKPQYELHRLKSLLSEASSRLNVPINAAVGIPVVPSVRPLKRSSVSDDSLSHNSDISQRNSSSQDINSFTNVTSEGSLPHVDSDSCESANNNMYYNQDMDSVIILGKAVALYDFDGTTEGTTSVHENEQLLVLEIDTGDGWTKIRKVNSTTSESDGFVPTSYLSLDLYPEVKQCSCRFISLLNSFSELLLFVKCGASTSLYTNRVLSLPFLHSYWQKNMISSLAMYSKKKKRKANRVYMESTCE
ncbi:Formin-binding protein 1-like [Trichinella spiralis]|uniref:Formin-binding protein 1-like n=1 Tax=Trichinella spiralis TaxID=6334 RepID=A0ABR3KIN8_TRISP